VVFKSLAQVCLIAAGILFLPLFGAFWDRFISPIGSMIYSLGAVLVLAGVFGLLYAAYKYGKNDKDEDNG
jgi:hypothetical protein